MRLKNIFLFNLLVFLVGCVGTVEQSQKQFTDTTEAGKSTLKFTGVNTVTAISDTRIEITFFPATGGSGKLTYDIQVGNAPFPISIPAEVLNTDYRGLLKTTVSNLTRSTNYRVKVEVRDSDGAKSNSLIVKAATTFSNEVCDFDGVASASNTAGQDGKDSIRLRWNTAKTSGGLIKQPWDPKAYEITVVDADLLTPGDMDIKSLGPSQGRYTTQVNHVDGLNEFVMRGLPSNKKLYARVRAIHTNSVDDVFDDTKRSEQNTNYTTIATLSGSLADINFQPQSFAVRLAEGRSGLTTVITNWASATGVFDHFRIYYGLENSGIASGNLPASCLAPLNSPLNAAVFCKMAAFNDTQTEVAGLQTYKKYEFVLVLCQTTSCENGKRIISPLKFATMTPDFAPFDGVKSVQIAEKFDDLGKIKINFSQSNFNLGFYDGLIIKMKRTSDLSDPEVTIQQAPTLTNTVYYLPFDYQASNQIVVEGIDYQAVDPYCFTVYPFQYTITPGTFIESKNEIYKCIVPAINPPSIQEFDGLDTVSAIEDRIELNWIKPTKGIYKEYEIYWTKTNSSFDWDTAILEAGTNFDFSHYGMVKVGSDEETKTLSGFASGTYRFGIITHVSVLTNTGIVHHRSDKNLNIFTCNVNVNNSGNITCTK